MNQPPEKLSNIQPVPNIHDQAISYPYKQSIAACRWCFEPLWPLLAAINSNSAGGWITFDTRLAFSLHILSLSQMHKSGCVRVVHAKVSQRQLTYIEAKPPCRTLFWARNNKYLSVLVHFKFNALKIIWRSGPLLCMACMSQPWFLFQFKNRSTCT